MSGNLTVKKKEAIEMLMFDLKRAEERAEDKGWIDADDLEMEIIEDKIEGGFVASFPELPGCITCGETIEDAVANALDAKKAWLEAAIEEGIEIQK